MKKDKFVKLVNGVNDDCFCHYKYGSNLTTANASPEKTYIKILARCRDYATAKSIYPGIKNPFRDDLVKLWQLNFVNRYSKSKYLKTVTVVSRNCGSYSYTYPTRVWWKITPKGEKLLKRIGV